MEDSGRGEGDLKGPGWIQQERLWCQKSLSADERKASPPRKPLEADLNPPTPMTSFPPSVPGGPVPGLREAARKFFTRFPRRGLCPRPRCLGCSDVGLAGGRREGGRGWGAGHLHGGSALHSRLAPLCSPADIPEEEAKYWTKKLKQMNSLEEEEEEEVGLSLRSPKVLGALSSCSTAGS